MQVTSNYSFCHNAFKTHFPQDLKSSRCGERLKGFCFVFFSGEELLKQLEKAREARKNAERMREELVKQAKLMQNKTQNRRNHGKLKSSFLRSLQQMECF